MKTAVFFVILLLCSEGFGAPNIADYAEQNGKVILRSRLNDYYLSYAYSKQTDDPNRIVNGNPVPTAKAKAAATAAATLSMHYFDKHIKPASEYSFQEAQAIVDQEEHLSLPPPNPAGDTGKTAVKPEKSDFEKFYTNIHIRATNADVTAAEDPTDLTPSDSFKSANPATFSYTRDYHNHTDQLALKGAVIYTYKFTDAFVNPLVLAPSAEFNRVTGAADKTKDADTLIFRLGALADFDWHVPNEWSVINEFRLYATYGTDFEFKSSVPAAELDWEPTTLDFPVAARFGLGHYESCHGLFLYSTRFYLHDEDGYVSSTGTKKQLVRGHDFFRVGPVVQFSVIPEFANDPLTITATYEYLKGITGSPSDSHDFKVAASWKIADTSNLSLSLTASYEDGLTPIVSDKTNMFVIGLGVKY